MYLSCEQFVNHFIEAVQHGQLERFHHYYRHLDALVIDDIHFLSDKERTQEEFFHTFNSLYQLQKQVILSSDSAPHEIPRLEERLVSRFKWGLVCRIDRPSFETRVAILQKKAQGHGKRIPDEVFRYIATHIDTNIRELEGAVVRLLGYGALCNRPIDMNLAQEALGDIVPRSPTSPTIQDIVEAVCQRYNVRLSDLQGKKRNRSTALPRQVCMYLARQLTNHSLQEIGAFFGGRDHTTVLHAERKIDLLLASDAVLGGILGAIRLELT
jgi:chromosomal replication initiator protein